MHDPAQIEAWRRMSPEERWKQTAALMEFAWRSLLALDPAERERRLEIAHRHHRLTNEAIVEALGVTERLDRALREAGRAPG